MNPKSHLQTNKPNCSATKSYKFQKSHPPEGLPTQPNKQNTSISCPSITKFTLLCVGVDCRGMPPPWAVRGVGNRRTKHARKQPQLTFSGRLACQPLLGTGPRTTSPYLCGCPPIRPQPPVWSSNQVMSVQQQTPYSEPTLCSSFFFNLLLYFFNILLII